MRAFSNFLTPGRSSLHLATLQVCSKQRFVTSIAWCYKLSVADGIDRRELINDCGNSRIARFKIPRNGQLSEGPEWKIIDRRRVSHFEPIMISFACRITASNKYGVGRGECALRSASN
jgi:hypothetical protein